MPRYIDAWKLIEYANNQKDKTVDANDIARFPTADVVPVKHGKWEKHRESYCSWSCSVCKEIVVAMPEQMGHPLYNYCPNCGTRMDGEDDEIT